MIPTATLRSWVGASVEDDGVLERLEAAAVAHAERVTGRYFGHVEEVTERIPWRRMAWGRRLYLRDLPATGYPVTVQFGESDADELEDDTAFVAKTTKTEAWLERTDGVGWMGSPYDYHVTYTRGYEVGTEPADVQMFVIGWVSERWNLRGMEGKLSESVGGYQVSVTSAITDRGHLEGLLAPWKRPVVA